MTKGQYRNKNTGYLGESFAAQYLQKHGFRILEKNSTSRWGEIDIIAEKSGVIHFVEVKTRRSIRHGKPVEAVTYQKLKKLRRSIEFYVHANALHNKKLQFDVIGIELSNDSTVSEMKYYPNVGEDLFL